METKAQRRRKQRRRDAPVEPTSDFFRYLPWIVVAIGALYFVWMGWPKSSPKDDFDLVGFGKLPIVHGGRAQPIDTFAQNLMARISDRAYYKDGKGKKQPATRWFLGFIAERQEANKAHVIRIHNTELLDALKLPRRKRYRFSYEEVRPHRRLIAEQNRLASLKFQQDKFSLNAYEKQVMKLENKLQLMESVGIAFRLANVPKLPQREDGSFDRTDKDFNLDINRISAQIEQADKAKLPLAIPVSSGDAAPADAESPTWKSFFSENARFSIKTEVRKSIPQMPTPSNPPVLLWRTMIAAFYADKETLFNDAVAEYERWLDRNDPDMYEASRVKFEAYFNRFAPFFHSSVLYLISFVLAAVSWLAWTRPLNRAAFWLMCLIFVVHTFAIIARMYIMKRPPVVNLYSTAIFIGWGCVVAGLIFEWMFRIGAGNVLASASGFTTLLLRIFCRCRATQWAFCKPCSTRSSGWRRT